MNFELKEYDRLAPYAISEWIYQAMEHGVNGNKIAKACRHLADILEYQENNPDSVKLPD